MSKATERPSAASALYYTPKWDMWYNGIVWQAINNCVNSFSVLEYEQMNIRGAVQTSNAVVPVDMFVKRVQVLYKLMLPGWGDNLFTPTDELMKKIIDGKQGGLMSYPQALNVFGEIIALLHRRGNIKFKQPFDPAD